MVPTSGLLIYAFLSGVLGGALAASLKHGSKIDTLDTCTDILDRDAAKTRERIVTLEAEVKRIKDSMKTISF